MKRFPGGNTDPMTAMLKENFEELYTGIVVLGKTFYLDPTNGSDTNDGSPSAPVATLAAGYALLRDGYNDALVYIPGATAIALSAGFEWKKNYAHFIGASAPVRLCPRCRIFLAAGTASQTYLFKVSGTGCDFSNILFFMGVADATAAHSVLVTGSRNHFRNCHIAGIGDATMDVAGAGSLMIDGGSENVFEGGTIGLDTVTRTTSTAELLFDSAATRNEFRDVLFLTYQGAAGHALVEIADAQGIDRVQRFVKCHFVADSLNRTVALTSVFKIPASINQGMIDLDAECHVSSWGSAAAWDSNSRGIISAAMVAPTAAGAGGISTHK